MNKMPKMKLLLLFSFLIAACETDIKQSEKANTREGGYRLVNEKGNTVSKRILTPVGYERVPENDHSFGLFLRKLPVKPHSTSVRLFNGDLKSNQSAHVAILDVTVGKNDLQQCADAVMRLRADYLMGEKRYDEISFDFTNGFKALYSQWRDGKSIQVNNNHCSWVSSSYANASAESYHMYLQKVFSYAGSLSLSRQLNAIADVNEIRAGDVWIRGGSPGHAVIVMDVAKDKKGRKIFLVAQSYMPAQDIHILNNPVNKEISPWYAIDEIETVFETPEYTFDKQELKRW